MIKAAREDKVIFWILVIGFLIQLLTAMLTIGTYHSDAHFHVVEFGMYLQDLPSAADHLWEKDELMRPSLKMYLFAGFYKLMNFLGVDNRYDIMLALRLMISTVNFFLFNYLLIRTIAKENKTALYAALLIFNFSWCFPYVRTSFSAEMLSSIFFFGGVLLYQIWNDKQHINFIRAMLIGLLLSLAFYARFQIAFAGIGFVIWLFFFEKAAMKTILAMMVGFGIGVLANTFMDYQLYGQLAITPLNYFTVNIVEGKAASFGTSSVLFYIIELTVVLLAPLVSLFLFVLLFRSVQKHYRDPYVLATVFFIVGHSMISHKEDRFLFPVFGVLPLMIAYVFHEAEAWYNRRSSIIKTSLKGVFVFSILLNTFVMGVLMFVPYSQGVEFGNRLCTYFEKTEQPIHIYSQRRSPFETISRLPLTYYEEQLNGRINIEITEEFPQLDLTNLPKGPIYICTTYNELHKNKTDLDLVAKYTPVLYSSKFLWNINEWLKRKGANTISENWVMYRVDRK